MVCPEKRLRVAILGARGIGKIHARIFQALGAEVCAVLGSSEATAAAAAHDLADAFGIEAQPYARLDALLAGSLDAVSICTPPSLHFAHTLAVLDRALPVFCEKPLFWHAGITPDEVATRLARLASHVNRRLFVNTSHASLLDGVRERLPHVQAITSFVLRFYTQGPYTGRDIAVDLLPHGLSLLLRLLGLQAIDNVSEDVTPHTYGCRFQYGHCAVEFDFQERPGGPKALVFAVNGQLFSRIQERSGAAYRVLLHDSVRGDKRAVPDPFDTYIAQFLHFCTTGAPRGRDAFEDAAANVQLMARLLLRDGPPDRT